METISFATACKKFFGLREGQSLLQFAQEVRGLTPADRAEMAPMLGAALGCTVTE